MLAFKYFEGLQECQNLATQAQHFLEETSHKVTTAAKMYGDVDAAAEDAMKKSAEGLDGPGILNGLNHSGGDGGPAASTTSTTPATRIARGT